MPPFSSVLGASSVVKPGVCTSTTRPTVPYEGQLIYETDTDRVAAYNGSAWVYTHSSGLVLISSTTIGSAVASVTVSSVFSSTYDNYLITINGGAASTANVLNMQLGATTTGYKYGGGNTGFSGTPTFNPDASNSFTGMAYVGAGTTDSLNGYAILQSPNLAKYTRCFSLNVFSASAGFAGSIIENATQYTAFTLVTSTGTVTGGTIRVYGYKN